MLSTASAIPSRTAKCQSLRSVNIFAYGIRHGICKQAYRSCQLPVRARLGMQRGIVLLTLRCWSLERCHPRRPATAARECWSRIPSLGICSGRIECPSTASASGRYSAMPSKAGPCLRSAFHVILAPWHFLGYVTSDHTVPKLWDLICCIAMITWSFETG